MENTNKLALTLGFGALGTVLAYYGYNQLTDEDDSENEDDTTECTTNSTTIEKGDENVQDDVNKTSDIANQTKGQNISVKTTESHANENEQQPSAIKSTEKDVGQKNSTTEQDKTNLGNEIKKELNTIKKDVAKDGGKWSTYWAGEYNKELAGDISVL